MPVKLKLIFKVKFAWALGLTWRRRHRVTLSSSSLSFQRGWGIFYFLGVDVKRYLWTMTYCGAIWQWTTELWSTVASFGSKPRNYDWLWRHFSVNFRIMTMELWQYDRLLSTCLPYLSHIWALSQPYLSHIQPYICQMSATCRPHLSHISLTSQPYLNICHITAISQQYLSPI